MADHVTLEAVIPVHRPERPVLQTVRSILDGLTVPARVTIVCHNIVPEDLDGYDELSQIDEVDFLTCLDGKSSPAAPRNLGLANANATWILLIDSDDEVEPGAVQSWIDLGEKTGAEAVVPRHIRKSGALVRTPAKRPWSTILDPIKDRVPYRVGHLGLVRLDTVKRLGLQYTEGLPTGEDLGFSAPLWFSGAPVVYGEGLPAYLCADGGSDHVTVEIRPTDELLAGVNQLLDSDFYRDLPADAKQGLAVKLLRGEVLTSARAVAGRATANETRQLARTIGRIVRESEGQSNPVADLSYADARLVKRILHSAKLGEPLTAEDGHRTLVTKVLPGHWRGWVSRNGPFRFAIASALMK